MLYTMRPSGSLLHQGLLDFLATVPAEARMAEIGCYRGEATQLFVTHVAHVTAVDPWTDYIETNDGNRQVPMTNLAEAEREFDAVAARYPDRLTKVKATSVEAAAQFPDGQFDLVYLDGNHGYDNVAEDLRAWRPKVKPGGLLAGHDYDIERLGVVRAVHDWIGEPDAVFPDATWVKRMPPGPKAVGPAPRLNQNTAAAPLVLIGIPCREHGGFRPFEMCLQQLMEGRKDTRVFYAMGSIVPGARNRIVREALKTGAQYIWFLDDDQPFFAGDPLQPDRKTDLDALLARNVDAVIPLSCVRKAPFLPLLFSTVHPTESVAIQRYLLPDDHGLIEVAAAGLAGLLIKTTVFLKLGLDGWFEFQHPSDNFDDYSEDLPFYRKLEQAGIQLYCDLDVRFGHAVSSVAYIVKQRGQWMTVLADKEPWVAIPQPQHPLGIHYSEKQRHKLVLTG